MDLRRGKMMGKKKKENTNFSYIRAVLVIAASYLALLTLLVYSEKGQPGSQINSFGDAVWYSLATLSTVGYGDITPVTAMGHVIGAVFLLLSMGVLVALFGSVVSMLTSEGLPMLKLRFLRKKNWYYIAEFSTEADALARDILREYDDVVVIYGVNRDQEIEKPDYPCLFINVSPARIVAHKKGVGRKVRMFFLEENDIGRNLKASGVYALDAEVYACTTSGQEKMSGNINFFHAYDCCARSYWREHPLCSDDNVIAILGFGNYGQALLERAILMNINDTDFDVSYHVFGDSRRFREIHNCLDTAFGIGERRPGHDSIYFHEEAWTAAREVIAQADRIIICGDDEEAGWDDLWQLQRYYRNKGNVYLRSNRPAPGVQYFGTDEQIYTVNQIVRTMLNEAARLMNNLYRSSVRESLSWDELSDRLRQSKIAAADHLFMKVRVLLGDMTITGLDRETLLTASDMLELNRRDPEKVDSLRRIEHARWARFYAYYNWKYGPARSEALHEDPKLREYDDLEEAEKAYYDSAWELIREIAAIIE